MLTTGQQLGCMCVQPGTARRVTGAERGQTSNGEADEVPYRRCSRSSRPEMIRWTPMNLLPLSKRFLTKVL